MAKAPVLPEPVSAKPMTSRPSRAAGMAWDWISVGEDQPMERAASHKGSTTPWPYRHGERGVPAGMRSSHRQLQSSLTPVPIASRGERTQ